MVRLRDVTLRDGLQDESPVSTDSKLLLLDMLAVAGVQQLELTSFTRPDLIPAMADADVLTERAVRQNTGVELWGLVLNRRGAERALANGLRHLQYVFSVSERHNLENAGRTPSESIDALEGIVELATANDAVVEVTLATAFGCPFDGAVDPEQVVALASRVSAVGVDRFSLADTIGTALPTEVAALIRQFTQTVAHTELGVHLHNTRGLAIANALAAIDAGATRLDGTVGGLGGCPFAPGASGNLVLEDLVHCLNEMGEDTGIDLDALMDASKFACELTGHRQESHVVEAGPRFRNVAVSARV